MKTSKSSSKGKRRRSPIDGAKKKHGSTNPKAVDKERKKEIEDKCLRKTRWETGNTKDDGDKKTTPTSTRNDETPKAEPLRHLKDMLGDKKKIVEYLFLTVTATALQELIPDYLKNRSIEEIQKMCYAEIKLMSDEHILEIASGTGSSHPVEVKSVEAKNVEAKENSDSLTFASSISPRGAVSESFSSDLLELCASSNDVEDLDNEKEEEIPVLEDQDDRSLKVIDGDADLIELEMRARAIRSLLKAKDKLPTDSD